MKKAVAIILALVLAASFSVVSFAAQSPGGTTKFTVTVTSNKGGSNKNIYKMEKNNDGTITLYAVKNGSEFKGWQILNGEYKIISGSLNFEKLVILPLSDLNIKAVYKVKGNSKPADKSPTSPKTGGVGVTLLGLTTVAALGCTVISKKKSVK